MVRRTGEEPKNLGTIGRKGGIPSWKRARAREGMKSRGGARWWSWWGVVGWYMGGGDNDATRQSVRQSVTGDRSLILEQTNYKKSDFAGVDSLLSLTLPVLMGHWPVRGSYQTDKRESRYSTRSTVLIKSASVTDRIWTCAISNSDPKDDVLDHSAIDILYPDGLLGTWGFPFYFTYKINFHSEKWTRRRSMGVGRGKQPKAAARRGWVSSGWLRSRHGEGVWVWAGANSPARRGWVYSGRLRSRHGEGVWVWAGANSREGLVAQQQGSRPAGGYIQVVRSDTAKEYGVGRRKQPKAAARRGWVFRWLRSRHGEGVWVWAGANSREGLVAQQQGSRPTRVGILRLAENREGLVAQQQGSRPGRMGIFRLVESDTAKEYGCGPAQTAVRLGSTTARQPPGAGGSRHGEGVWVWAGANSREGLVAQQQGSRPARTLAKQRPPADPVTLDNLAGDSMFGETLRWSWNFWSKIRFPGKLARIN
ncbi:hypothetical protein J6590_066302 [Homalodisca vitripennis]|nr:hypothetical protein J6590_066302 [Homalodisca vitripennis]